MIKGLSGLAILSVGLAQQEGDIYDCAYCMFSTERAIENGESIYQACSILFPDDEICAKFNNAKIDASEKEMSARGICEKAGTCHPNKKQDWRGTRLRNSENLDIRVSKAYGSKGYDKVRISVISDAPVESELFTYSEPFVHRWTSYYLNTGVTTIIPGQDNIFKIADQSFTINIPAENSPVRGVVVGDPCFSNDYVWCSYGDDFDTYNRSTLLLNAIHTHDDNDFWMILGDNFYDQTGEITAEWFAALSPETKSRVSLASGHGHALTCPFYYCCIFVTLFHKYDMHA
jgi:hypothetical protein